MNKYRFGKIYKLCSNQTDNIYIGSTIQKLCSRMAIHKYHFKNKIFHCNSKELLIFNDCKIILIEEYPCNNKLELLSRERYWIEKLKCVNSRLPGRTIKEYYETNRCKILEYGRNYSKKHYNKDKKKLYYQNNKINRITYGKEYYKNKKLIENEFKLLINMVVNI